MIMFSRIFPAKRHEKTGVWPAAAPASASSRIKRLARRKTHANVAAILLLASGVAAAGNAPDLTRGDKPTPMKKSTKLLIGNLGPTGLLGWVYHERQNTSQSRQILITAVDPGSPADGVLQVGDVILGANGAGATPGMFTADARKSFALAIGDAEARDPAVLKMAVWRKGETSMRSITLETMGAYSPTAPYNCPKSMKIIEKALGYLNNHELKRDRFGLNILALLACNDGRFPGNAERLKRAREWLIDMLPRPDQIESMTSDRVETYSKIAWNRSYMLIVLAEYYLATGDNPSKGGVDLLTAIDAHAQTVARGQSMFGTMGHQFAIQGEDGSVHGPYRVGYGPINATGLASFLGLTLARDCNLPNAETRTAINEGIQRAAPFFASYVGRGAIPYGEHPPWTKSHCSNGKSGLAAIVFARVKDGQKAAHYYTQLSIASGAERIGGHGGAFFNYLWTPLGANVGGEAAAAAYFKQVSWHLDLARTWDGGFFYNDFGTPGYNGKTFGKASLYMSTPALLTYAVALRKLVITGRDLNQASRLSPAEVAEASFASGYTPSRRTWEQLISDLGSFSVVVRNKAATEFASRPGAEAWRNKLQAVATDRVNPSRIGAIQALGAMGNPESAAVLSRLFGDADPRIREAAVEAFGAMPQEVKAQCVDELLKMAAALRRPPMKVDKDDPVNTTLIALTTVLFDKQGILGGILAPVDTYSSREQLYKAIRAVATLPSGGERGKLKFVFDLLSVDDVRALADTLLELVYVEAPADAMFAEGIRATSVKLLLKYRTVEGVRASVALFKVGGRWTKVVIMREWAKLGRSLTTIKEGKQIPELLRKYNDKKFKNEAKKALEAIADQTKPLITFKQLNPTIR